MDVIIDVCTTAIAGRFNYIVMNAETMVWLDGFGFRSEADEYIEDNNMTVVCSLLDGDIACL